MDGLAALGPTISHELRLMGANEDEEASILGLLVSGIDHDDISQNNTTALISHLINNNDIHRWIMLRLYLDEIYRLLDPKTESRIMQLIRGLQALCERQIAGIR